MCGIFGIVYTDGRRTPDARRLDESVALLRHRGPDSSGTCWEPGIGLGHTRLALLDLSQRAKQPFWDPKGRYCLVYNGEIYNFKELRQELEVQGVRFRTTSDTEVLLHSLILHGAEATLPRLEGMFAFGLYDKEERSLLLARDRFGIKPLYVYQGDGEFLFTSEVKAMKPWVCLKPNPFPITSYLLGFGGPTKNDCFYDRIQIIAPGSLIRLKIGERAVFDRFIKLTDEIDLEEAEELRRLSPKRVVDWVDELLQRSVKQVLFADAPVGALCSGGVDSSVVMAIAARYHNNLAIFHANVVGPSSEYEAALELSKHLKLDLKKVDVHDQDFIDLIPEVSVHYEHPFSYHPNSIPFLMVSKLVRQNDVKAILSGEGADECFLGYQHLAQEPFVRFYERQVKRLARLVNKIPLFGKFLWPEASSAPALVTGMLNHFERELEEKLIREEYAAARGTPPDWNIRTLHQLSYHLRTTLHRNDCLGMAASIEARFPFLDSALTKTAINLPHNTKIRFSPSTWEKSHPFLRDKWVLRKVADRYVPHNLSRRKKLAFPVTAFERMTIGVSYFRDSFVSDYFQLRNRELDHLVEDADQPLKIRLLLLDAWGRTCLRSTPAEKLTELLRQHVSIEA